MIYTIKERARSTCHAVPFKIYTSLTTISLIEGVVDFLNMLPSKYGVSGTLSLPTIVEVRPKLDMVQKRISFGSYAAVHIGKNKHNEKQMCLVIELKASNNYGGYYSMNIFTGKLRHSYNWK